MAMGQRVRRLLFTEVVVAKSIFTAVWDQYCLKADQRSVYGCVFDGSRDIGRGLEGYQSALRPTLDENLFPTKRPILAHIVWRVRDPGGVGVGGSLMSLVVFKKWQCPLSLFMKFPVDFKIVQCPLSLFLKNP